MRVTALYVIIKAELNRTKCDAGWILVIILIIMCVVIVIIMCVVILNNITRIHITSMIPIFLTTSFTSQHMININIFPFLFSSCL